MKRFSKRMKNWGLAGLGIILAVLTYCGYKMYSVVYGPRPDYDPICLYGPRPIEITDSDSLGRDEIKDSENISKDSMTIKSLKSTAD